MSMKRFLRQHVGLRYGLLVGLVGLIQLAAAAVPMVSNHDTIVRLQQTQAAFHQCQDNAKSASEFTNCYDKLGEATPSVYDLGTAIGLGYLVSLPAVFVLYLLAGRTARRTPGRERLTVGTAFVAA